jgi:fluoroacetyl-CoA thioesterase
MRYDVSEGDSAIALGSGDVPVLATPRLIAWMEAVTLESAIAFLETGETTVGTTVRIEHRRATPVGGSVEVTATPTSDVGARRLTFAVAAIDDSGHVLAEGEIIRAIVDRDRFLRAAEAGLAD